MSIERPVSPSDLMFITTQEEFPLLKVFGQPVHVGLRVNEILGEEAAQAWGQYELHAHQEYPQSGRYFDPQVAREAYEKFTKIAGFTPDELEIEIYVWEMAHGFSTVRL